MNQSDQTSPSPKLSSTNVQQIFKDLFWPLALLALLTLLFAHFGLDLRLQTLFYKTDSGWFLGEKNPWILLYKYGNIPALLFMACAVVLLILGFWSIRFTKFRKIALLFILSIVIGPGLFVNMVFKDHWGRPRPRDIVQFGGTMQYCEPYHIGVPGKGKSFPCGHASIGFVLLVPAFFLRRRNRLLASAFLALGLAYGTLMGIGRMAQGGHFASDVIWAAGMVYLSALGLFYLLRMNQNIYWEPGTANPKYKGLITSIIIVTALLIFTGIILATPNHGKGCSTSPTTMKITHYYLSETDLSFGSVGGICWEYAGFGFPKSKIISQINEQGADSEVRLRTKGLFTELRCQTILDLEKALSRTNIITIQEGVVLVDMEKLGKTEHLELNVVKGDVHIQYASNDDFHLIASETSQIDIAGSGLRRVGDGYLSGNGGGPVIKITTHQGRIRISPSRVQR